jgi:HK97 family phage portal protein
MMGYKLSAGAAAVQAHHDRQRQQREIRAAASATWTPDSGKPSAHDQDNFVTNRMTVADYMDRVACSNPLGLSATYACVNLIAGTIASLSATVYRTGADRVRTAAEDHPLYWLLKLDPNFDDTDYEFWEFIAATVELQGNAYAEISRNGAGHVAALTPVYAPVQVRRLGSGEREYEWTEGGRRNVRAQADVLHIRGFGGDRLKGGSTLSACSSAFSSAVATDTMASRMFANSALPSGVLSTDTRLEAPQRSELEDLLQAKFMGAVNAGRPMLLDGGLKWQSLTITPEDAQLLDSRKFGGEEICRIFGVPPGMVGYGDKSSNWGTGKEVDVLGFIKFTLRKRLRRMERALMKQLLTRAERQAGMTIEFNLEGLLRGDSAGRAAFYQIMVRLGLMTRNEARHLENLPPIPGGDVAMVQMQDVPLETAIQNAKDDAGGV